MREAQLIKSRIRPDTMQLLRFCIYIFLKHLKIRQKKKVKEPTKTQQTFQKQLIGSPVSSAEGLLPLAQTILPI